MRHRLALALLAITAALAAAAVYWPALDCEFVFDDRFAIENNADTTSQVPLEELFLHDFWGGFATSRRRLCTLARLASLPEASPASCICPLQLVLRFAVLFPLPSPAIVRVTRVHPTCSFFTAFRCQRPFASGLCYFAGKRMTAHDSHKSYRPLTTLLFRWEWHLSGGAHDPRLAHAVNVGLHSIVSGMMVLLSARLLPASVLGRSGSLLCAATTGLVFAVHPIHTESVVGVVSRADILCTLFFIAGLVTYLWVVGWQPGDVPPPAAQQGDTTAVNRLLPRATLRGVVGCVGFGLLFLLSTLSKELGVGLVAVCGMWELVRR